jgi:putative DNA primase/helicase
MSEPLSLIEHRRAVTKKNGKAAPQIRADQDLTEDAVAAAFAKEHAGSLRFCHSHSSWFEWDGSRWVQDVTRSAFHRARLTCRTFGENSQGRRLALGKAATASAIEKFAQADRAFAVSADNWDRDPFLLGTPSGVVNLRTGEMQPARPGDYITKQTAVAPADSPNTPRWDTFLSQATNNDPALVRFIRQWLGYSLTGDTREQALVFGYGPGQNGKSVLLNTAAGIMGDYACAAAMETFCASSSDRHPTDLAMLRGARMVSASETEEGRAWAETRIKTMTGGDMISARFMHRDFFQYRPQFKLIIVGNHKPVLKNIDDAAKRRFNVVPFVHKPPAPDRQLEEKLKSEWPAILRWMIEGCLDWQRNGLVRPDVVADATADYFQSQDFFARWLSERAKLDPMLESKPGILFVDFRAWCASNGEPLTDNRTMRGMIERTAGLRYVTKRGSQFVKGIGLNADPDGRQAEDQEGRQ